AIRYTYDFGDDWEHDVLVEKVLDRDSTISYPRCTGGRRAAPPEDCGGIWGYADLTQTLTDPTHPGHDDMLDWLGLGGVAEPEPVQHVVVAWVGGVGQGLGEVGVAPDAAAVLRRGG